MTGKRTEVHDGGINMRSLASAACGMHEPSGEAFRHPRSILQAGPRTVALPSAPPFFPHHREAIAQMNRTVAAVEVNRALIMVNTNCRLGSLGSAARGYICAINVNGLLYPIDILKESCILHNDRKAGRTRDKPSFGKRDILCGTTRRREKKSAAV